MSNKEIEKYVDSNFSKDNGLIIRVACYIRVSTQEQKLHGISLDSQRDKLKEYAEKHHLKIVEWYEDEGVSGRKLIKNRPELQRMIKDAQAGKFDRIIFIKLDRFFRSVAEYHECMKKIDPVLWTATEEKYDLTTANGRAFVNMKITIAELEADQTGERIDLVNEYKVKTGQPLTGAQSQGLAWTVVKDKDGVKRVVKDPDTKDMIMDLLDYYMLHQAKAQTCRYISEKYGINMKIARLNILIKDTKLYGFYRGNPNYCEPYIDKKTFNKIQEIANRNIKRAPSKNVYLYNKLVKCPKCNSTLAHTYNQRGVITLRCNNYGLYKTCDYNKRPREVMIEDHLLNNLDSYVTDYISEANIEDNREDKNTEAINKKIASVNSEMTKVKRMYRKGDIPEPEYDKDMAELKEELKHLESQLEPIEERDLTIYEDLLKTGWRGLYDALNKENKRAFWHKYIKTINLNVDGTVKEVIFF